MEIREGNIMNIQSFFIGEQSASKGNEGDEDDKIGDIASCLTSRRDGLELR